jgi:hypothetical protein
MDLTRDPDTMTPADRQLEVVGILAAGLLRCLRTRPGSSSPQLQNRLDLLAKSRLSVAQRPRG